MMNELNHLVHQKIISAQLLMCLNVIQLHSHRVAVMCQKAACKAPNKTEEEEKA